MLLQPRIQQTALTNLREDLVIWCRMGAGDLTEVVDNLATYIMSKPLTML